MDFIQWAQNPWGQEVPLRISWDLFWAALIVGAVFVVGHLIIRPRLLKSAAKEEAPAAPEGVPEKVVRHSMVSRVFHWIMAVSMLVLLVTGFLPQVGIQFSWVTPHWIAGVVLIASILFHMVHASVFQSLRNIWISPGDLREFIQEMRHSMGQKVDSPRKPGKYPADHKMFHHAAVLTGFAVMITGVYMMFRIETPFFTRNPYLMSDSAWGWVYVLHGLGGVGLVFLTISHVYFAILPEKRWITMSMIFGWISRDKYLEHHDPERWQATEGVDK